MNKARPIKSVIVLTVICLITAILLATVNYFTSSVIQQNEINAENAALMEVLPYGDSFEEVYKDEIVDSKVDKIYKAKNGKGYVFKIISRGYGANLIIICGISNDGKVVNAKCMSSNETLGYEKTYGEKFIGVDKTSVNDVDTIAGATKTSVGYKEAISIALNSFDAISKKAEKEIK